MASLTPGVLSKLLQHAGTDFKVAGHHRSPLLQVLEIVPSSADDPLQSSGFFLKVSDSLHSTFVSISDADADLIFANKIQLGQLIHVSGLDYASPVPVLRGVRPVPKPRSCIGSPRDLVAGDLLSAGDERSRRTDARASRRLSLGGGGGKEAAELKRRTSAESLRKGWERSPGAPKRNLVQRSPPPSDPKQKNKSSPFDSPSAFSDKKISPKSDLSNRQGLGTSPLKIKGNHASLGIAKPSRKDTKSSGEEITPCHLAKMQLSLKDRKHSISWDALPSSLHDPGKGVLQYRDAAFCAAVESLLEAQAAESVIQSLSMFADICDSAKQAPPSVLVERFLNLHQSLRQVATLTDAILMTRHPETKCNLLCQQEVPEILNDKKTVATSWVQAAIGTNLSSFSLYDNKVTNGSHSEHRYVVLGTPSDEIVEKSKNPQTKQSLKKQAGVPVSGTARRISLSRGTPTKKNNEEKAEQLMGPGLKEAASVAKHLLLFSRGWFLKYLDGAFDDRFGIWGGKEDSGIAGFAGQLKRVNLWLDDMVGEKFEIDECVEKLRKKLYRFLLDHVDYTVAASRE